ncbi:hypothetical protein [Serinicoccus sediminis]|uniref:hypothetical protein n=1 Tax=Serinicoccus sediminis TaxID=2306021 RepID=UPI00101F43C0|nr:hypothetical protein [Serinicoccus sediminis]
MLNRRHRDRLKEFARPQAGQPDYREGTMGAAVTEPGGPSGAGQSEGGEGEQFDPAAHTIPQVLDHLGVSDGHDPVTVEEFDRVVAAERDGKDRSTLLKQLEEYAAARDAEGEQFDPSAHEVDEVLAYLAELSDEDADAHDAEVARVVEAEKAGQGRAEVIESVEGTPGDGDA